MKEQHSEGLIHSRDAAPSATIDRFVDALEVALDGTSVGAWETLELAEERLRFSYSSLSENLASGEIDVRRVLERCLNREVRSLCILPVPGYIAENLEVFDRSFERLVLCDNGKAEVEAGSRSYLTLSELASEGLDCDAYLIPTNAREIQAVFREQVPVDSTVLFESFATEVERVRQGNDGSGVVEFLKRVRSAKRPLIIAVGIYFNTYTPTFKTLAKQGYDLFFVARSSTLWLHAGHLRNLDGALPFADVLTVDLDGMLQIVSELDVGLLYLPGAEDTFISHSFSYRRSVSSHAYVTALANLARVPVFLALYDIVKPTLLEPEFAEAATSTYGRMLKAVSAVSAGANTTDSADVITTALAPETPCRSFYRFAERANELLPHLDDGFHLVVVGALLGESTNPFWIDRDALRGILRQGIHLHVYSSTSTPQKFRAGLTEAERECFHIHAAIENQQELLRDVSQYHAGFLVNNTSAIAESIASRAPGFQRELAQQFWSSMVSSAAMLYAGAGIPMFLNRCSTGVMKEFPSEYFLPIEVPEFGDLRERLKNIDWETLHRKTRSQCGLFSIEENISELVSLLEQALAR